MKRLAASLKKHIGFYALFWRFAFNLQFAYQFDTFVIIVSVLAYNLVNFLFYNFSISRMQTLGGWSLADLVVLTAISNQFWMFSKILYENNFEACIDNINSGNLDFYLLKPISKQFLIFFFPPDFIKISFFPLAILFFYAAFRLDPNVYDLTVVNILGAIISFILSLVINYSFSLIMVSASFYSGRVDQIFSFFLDTHELMKYPLEIFTGPLNFILRTILPVGLLAGLTTRFITGRIDNWFATIGSYLLLTAVFIIISQYFWYKGIRNYTSASS